MLGSAEEEVVGIFLSVEGDLMGTLCLSRKDAQNFFCNIY